MLISIQHVLASTWAPRQLGRFWYILVHWTPLFSGVLHFFACRSPWADAVSADYAHQTTLASITADVQMDGRAPPIMTHG